MSGKGEALETSVRFDTVGGVHVAVPEIIYRPLTVVVADMLLNLGVREGDRIRITVEKVEVTEG